jgi:TonB family protein
MRGWGRVDLGIVLIALLSGCGGASKTDSDPIELPQVLNDTLPFTYPLELWDNRISGETMLLLRISELGAVDSVVIGKSSGFAEFDSAALQGARVLRFTPGKQGERRVAMWTKLPVKFARDTTKKMGLGANEHATQR